MLIALMARDGFEPMRVETDEDTEIRRPEPDEFGDTSHPNWPFEIEEFDIGGEG